MKITLVPGFNPGPYTGAGNNTYLLHDPDGKQTTLIDAATGNPRHLNALKAAVGSGELARVVVTHGHSDHIAGTLALSTEWPKARFAKKPWIDRDADYPVAWQPLADGDSVNVGNTDLQIIHTPGHSPDHICLYDQAEGVLFSGDLLVQGSTVVIPGTRGGNLIDYLASLVRIRHLEPLRVFPAHGQEIEDVVELIDQYIQHRRQRDIDIFSALAFGSLSPADIVEHVYVGLVEDLKPAATESVLAHLVKLETEGQVTRVGYGGNVVWERA